MSPDAAQIVFFLGNNIQCSNTRKKYAIVAVSGYTHTSNQGVATGRLSVISAQQFSFMSLTKSKLRGISESASYVGRLVDKRRSYTIENVPMPYLHDDTPANP